MATTVAELTPAELRAMIEEIVHDQLVDLIGDPDQGLKLRPEVWDQLKRQQERVRQGDLGTPLSTIPRPSRE